jgi:hypothetical protein
MDIALGVLSIISGIVSVGRVVYEFQESRKQKKQKLKDDAEEAEARLLTTVSNAEPRINTEYGHDVARIGEAFKQGDGTKITST